MTDRELLEGAARAVGYRIHGWIGEKFYVINGPNPAEHYDPFPWNPLTDDGDAFRLMVGLGAAKVLDLELGPGGACVTFHHPMVEADEFNDPRQAVFDAHAATRRAIVRAAAEIGSEQPDT